MEFIKGDIVIINCESINKGKYAIVKQQVDLNVYKVGIIDDQSGDEYYFTGNDLLDTPSAYSK